MKYTTSEHYRECPYEEIDAALSAGNSLDSTRFTIESRLNAETHRRPPDTEAVQRIQRQLAHINALSTQVEVAA